tara:strand:- start:231 stop:365 length:135 start_codon:yes stop_codon:yes gene_type:complete
MSLNTLVSYDSMRAISTLLQVESFSNEKEVVILVENWIDIEKGD